jgi:putative hemolysin
MAAPQAVGSADVGLLELFYFQEQDPGSLEYPSTTIDVSSLGLKILGGGAYVTYNGVGLLLTDIYPASPSVWRANAKDQQQIDYGQVTAYCVAADVPSADYQIVSIESTVKASDSQATATLPPGYELTGGGAAVQANWSGYGNLLYGSYPSASNAWSAASKDHQTADPSTVTAYAIGLSSSFLAKNHARTVRAQATSGAPEASPWCEANVAAAPAVSPAGTCGGALDNWKSPGAGNMLTGVYPVGDQVANWTFWRASGKDHMVADPATITAYALGLAFAP